jgi:hypothetical protein
MQKWEYCILGFEPAGMGGNHRAIYYLDGTL